MKKLMMLVAVAAMSLGAHADLLYFLVNSFTYEGPTCNFAYAMVGVAKNGNDGWTTTWGGTEGDQKVYLKVKADGGVWADYVESTPVGYYTEAGPAWADVSGYNEDIYAFYIETYGEDDGLIWGYNEETAIGYAALEKQGHIYQDNITGAPDVTVWEVPEPTSGLLLLIGCAALGLRRKRPSVEVEG